MRAKELHKRGASERSKVPPLFPNPERHVRTACNKASAIPYDHYDAHVAVTSPSIPRLGTHPLLRQLSLGLLSVALMLYVLVAFTSPGFSLLDPPKGLQDAWYDCTHSPCVRSPHLGFESFGRYRGVPIVVLVAT